jgi:hypothetical protein
MNLEFDRSKLRRWYCYPMHGRSRIITRRGKRYANLRAFRPELAPQPLEIRGLTANRTKALVAIRRRVMN